MPPITDPDDPRHGTPAGHSAHVRAGSPPCEPCRDARSAYVREFRARPDAAPRVRRGNRARSRALWRLARMYPDDYRRLMAEELANDTTPPPKETP